MGKEGEAHSVSAETQARLDAVAAGLKALNLTDFGVVQNELEIASPRELAVPHVWKWDAVSPWLDKVYAGMSLNEVHRRTLALSNPGLKRPLAATTMLCSMSIYYPGDLAGVHRHMASASRFLLEGSGGYTTVGGEKCPLQRADLVITPNGEWHDHGNDGTTPIIWVNVLDIGLVEWLNAVFTEWEYYESNAATGGAPRATKTQTFIRPVGWSETMFGNGGIVPRFGPENRGRGVHSPKYLYQWSRTRETLQALRNESGSPHDGIIVEYTNPLTGGSVVPTMSFQAQLLRPGESTRAHRHTASTVYTVVEGAGYSEIEGKRHDWTRNDVFVIPGWLWHRHVNTAPAGDACLYSVSDAPTHHKLHLYREQERLDSGEIREVHPWPNQPAAGTRVPAELKIG
ncbi:MAG: cupin domain-containing protein [Betaproteobacteria bacterium]|nr:cupin domain-containing protein [Betaproteobacteria bacterium]